MVKKKLFAYYHQRFVYFAVSWTGVVLFYLEWITGSELSASTRIKFIILLIFMLGIPFCPAIISLAIIILSLLFSYVLSPPNTYWLSSISLLTAVFVLGYIFRKLIPAIAIFVFSQVSYFLSLLFQIQNLQSFLFTYQPAIIAWVFGVFLGRSIDLQLKNSVIEEKSRYRENQLKTLHILHDSIANDLVYAISRSHALEKCLTTSNEITLTNDIVSTLETSLIELRREVIQPAKDELNGMNISSVRAHDVYSHVSLLKQDLENSRFRLRSHGFIGAPQLIGDVGLLDDDLVTLVDSCVKEISGNILKYGIPSDYALVVNIMDDDVSIISSNTVSAQHVKDRVSSSNSGLAILSDEVKQRGGNVIFGVEDKEWSIYVTIPCHGGKEIL